MTHRERILSTIRRRPTDQIPWVPRLDLWYIAQRARGTLPPRLRGLNMVQLAEALDVACHSLRADFTLPRESHDHMLSSLGFDNHPDYPFRLELRGLPLDFKEDSDSYSMSIRTAAGEVSGVLKKMTHEMQCEGIYALFPLKFAMASADECEAIAEAFEHLEVVPTPDAYAAYHRRIGEQGVALASGPTAASPLHFLLHNLMNPENFFLEFNDYPDALLRLAGRMEPVFEKILDALMLCEAEVVLWGSNYDQNITWPGFFSEHIAPWAKAGQRPLSRRWKTAAHPRRWREPKAAAALPALRAYVAESVCPAPMTRCSLKELRAGMGPAITVWGGLPSTAFLPTSMNDAVFEDYLEKVFADLGSGERLIFGVSDNVPTNADMARLERVKKLIQDFGPVRPN